MHLRDLNNVQQEAVKAVNGPVMIIAGAGSGKTRVLTYRIAHLLDLGVRPDSILALTFTNKAANEMRERIRALLRRPDTGLWMGTFHSVFARILRRECEHLGYSRTFSIYDSDDSLSVIKQIMNSFGISQQQFSPQGIRSRVSVAKNQMLSASQYGQSVVDPFGRRVAQVYTEYQTILKNSNAMDFDDLLLKPIELFERHPDILERYHHRFKYVLVDEYQDTNRVQYRLIQQLGKQHRNVCVVGDDAQSIYGFRGADIRNILDFEKDYSDCTVFRLEQNYRSTKTILAAADSVIKRNAGQIPKNLWTDNADGEPITLNVCSDDQEEGYRIVHCLQEETLRRKLDLKSFAILYRTNAQSRSLEDALRRNGIPYRIVGGVAFYKRREIKDVLAYLRLVANPQDTESVLRVINVPVRSIGDTTIKKLKAFAAERKLSLFNALGIKDLPSSIADRTTKSIRQFHAMVNKYISLKEEMSVSELARSMLDDIGFLQMMKEENTVESRERRENLLEFVSGIADFADKYPEAKLEQFLEEVSLVSDVDSADFSRNAVTLMTLHSAKGLEFPVVFITGIEEGLFPVGGSVDEDVEIEEERRLFYVGITRAMTKLYLSYALSRYRFGERAYAVKSRFLDEIDQSHVETRNSYARSAGPYRRTNSQARSISSPVARKKQLTTDVDQYFRDPPPDSEEESQEVFNAHVGSIVTHESFGKGRILAIDGNGENLRAIVDFESVGRKHLMLKFAHLRPV